MNTIEFKIRFQLQDSPRDNPFADIDEEWPPYYRLLHRYLLKHDGIFSLCFGEQELELSLDPDLLTVFEELPNALARIRSTREQSYLDFFEQGRDIVMILTPQEQYLKIDFDIGSTASSEFIFLKKASYLVNLSQFTTEWVRFLNAILAAIEVEGTEEEITSCREYREYMEYMGSK